MLHEEILEELNTKPKIGAQPGTPGAAAALSLSVAP
jgi:hypothetical protein